MDGFLAQSDPSDRRGGAFKIEIAAEDFAFRPYEADARKILGKDVAELAGVPDPDAVQVLRHLDTGELESIRPTEELTLDHRGVTRFFVIEGGESYHFKVGDLSMEWPRATLAGAQIKVLAKAGEDQDLFHLSEAGEALLEDEDVVTFAAAGVERFALKKAKKTVTVTFNDIEFELERRRWTTEQLTAVFKPKPGYVLDLIEDDGEFRELKPGESLKIRDGMAFTAHPPCGHSS